MSFSGKNETDCGKNETECLKKKAVLTIRIIKIKFNMIGYYIKIGGNLIPIVTLIFSVIIIK